MQRHSVEMLNSGTLYLQDSLILAIYPRSKDSYYTQYLVLALNITHSLSRVLLQELLTLDSLALQLSISSCSHSLLDRNTPPPVLLLLSSILSLQRPLVSESLQVVIALQHLCPWPNQQNLQVQGQSSQAAHSFSIFLSLSAENHTQLAVSTATPAATHCTGWNTHSHAWLSTTNTSVKPMHSCALPQMFPQQHFPILAPPIYITAAWCTGSQFPNTMQSTVYYSYNKHNTSFLT